MSSDEFQILKISQRTRQINPKQNTSKIIQSKTSYQKVVTGGQTGTRYHRTIKPETTIASRRELNQSSLAYAGGKIQLPVRTTVTNQGRSQRTQETKAYKYENNANNNGINRYSRNQDKQVSSVGKAQVQRYNSAEQQKNFYKRYETSGSPVNRRTGPMTLGNKNANFNLKKWAYVSNKDMNKIIILQRWWRYLLKRIISKHGRHRRTYANQKAMLRSKSTKNPTSEFLKDFIKQGENITEKVYPGKNNKLIVETRKVEVFKNTKPKSKSKLKLKKTGENFTIIPSIRIDFGCNISIGENFFSNFNLSILDEGYITFGNNCYIGPNCSFYTACHPIDFNARNAYFEWTKKINVGDNVCFEGNVTVLPGVNVGNNVLVRAGTVITKNVKDNCVVSGNPCVIEKEIN